ncbi:MAG: zf-TFIIB domain-containing protein [Gemmatimonadales bacterium]|nr:zf-TFIIB domain-containing protein [Gemmatimonadales bacterium]
MSTEKPSKNEDEYFAKEDAERIRKMREKEAAERVAAERKSHHMKCPKCGGSLQTENFQEIQIDRCPDCGGVWFDHGEVEQIMKHEETGTLGRVMGELWGSLQGKKRKS